MPPDVINNIQLPKPRSETFRSYTEVINRIRAYSKEAGFYISNNN